MNNNKIILGKATTYKKTTLIVSILASIFVFIVFISMIQGELVDLFTNGEYDFTLETTLPFILLLLPIPLVILNKIIFKLPDETIILDGEYLVVRDGPNLGYRKKTLSFSLSNIQRIHAVSKTDIRNAFGNFSVDKMGGIHITFYDGNVHVCGFTDAPIKTAQYINKILKDKLELNKHVHLNDVDYILNLKGEDFFLGLKNSVLYIIDKHLSQFDVLNEVQLTIFDSITYLKPNAVQRLMNLILIEKEELDKLVSRLNQINLTTSTELLVSLWNKINESLEDIPFVEGVSYDEQIIDRLYQLDRNTYEALWDYGEEVFNSLIDENKVLELEKTLKEYLNNNKEDLFKMNL